MEQSTQRRLKTRKAVGEPGSNFWSRIAHVFATDAAEWGLTPPAAWILALAPILVSLGVAATIQSPDLFRWLIDEDSVIENFQFLLIFLASLVYGSSGMHLLRSGRRGLGVLSALCALATFFVAGEEISWGQRIFGIATPARLEAINWQREISAHNIYGFNGPFTYALMLVGLYGTIMPLALRAFSTTRQRSTLSYFLIPPLCLVPGFFMPFGYRLCRMVLRPELHYPHRAFAITEFSEVTELCLYFAVLVFAWLDRRRLRQELAS
jgi:hypothetical protein